MLHRLKDRFSVQLIPRSRHDRCHSVVLTQQSDRVCNLFIRSAAGMRKNDRGCGADLIHIEFTEILCIHLAFSRISHRAERSKHDLVGKDGGDRSHDIRKLTDTRGLDQNTVGMILLQYFAERLREVADKRAADATGIHLRNIDPCLLKKAAVNSDLTEFVLNKNDLLADIRFLQ